MVPNLDAITTASHHNDILPLEQYFFTGPSLQP
jgi:hypothetical protein